MSLLDFAERFSEIKTNIFIELILRGVYTKIANSNIKSTFLSNIRGPRSRALQKSNTHISLIYRKFKYYRINSQYSATNLL